jgi:PDF receptor
MLMQDENTCIEYLVKVNQIAYKSETNTGSSVSGCNGTFDGVLCWNATKANTTAIVQCPIFNGLFDSTKFLKKTCMEDSTWEGTNKTGRYSGHTDFDPCYTANVRAQSEKYKSVEYSALIYQIVYYVELIGLILSVICVCFSLFIFFYHKSLRCRRTKIHLNLLITILMQSIVRLVFFLDRFLFKLKETPTLSLESQFMVYHKAICPILTIVLEYLQTCNFMWMLNEGIYINILLTYTIFENNGLIVAFYIIGWGLPAIVCITWATTLYTTIGIDDICWFGYYEWKSYWIIQAPILCVILVNLFCLLNIVRILYNKLKSNRNNEIDQIIKSSKAALVLLPLLGITHAFEVYHGEIKNWIINLMFSVITAFLVFNQGVFLSILYCFMNNEVKSVIERHWCRKSGFTCPFFKAKKVRERKLEIISDDTSNKERINRGGDDINMITLNLLRNNNSFEQE